MHTPTCASFQKTPRIICAQQGGAGRQDLVTAPLAAPAPALHSPWTRARWRAGVPARFAVMEPRGAEFCIGEALEGLEKCLHRQRPPNPDLLRTSLPTESPPFSCLTGIVKTGL